MQYIIGVYGVPNTYSTVKARQGGKSWGFPWGCETEVGLNCLNYRGFKRARQGREGRKEVLECNMGMWD